MNAINLQGIEIRGTSVADLRELRLASLAGDGVLVDLCDAVEDVIAEADGADLQDVREELAELKSNAKDHEKEVNDCLQALDDCSSLDDIPDAVALLKEERDKADARRDEQRDALHRLQDAVTKIAGSASLHNDQALFDALTAAVAASDDGTPQALRATGMCRAASEAYKAERDLAIWERDDARKQRDLARAERDELRAAKPKRTRKAKVTP